MEIEGSYSFLVPCSTSRLGTREQFRCWCAVPRPLFCLGVRGMREAPSPKATSATRAVGHGRTRALNKGRGTWRPCGSWRTGRRGGTGNEELGTPASDPPELPRPSSHVPPRSAVRHRDQGHPVPCSLLSARVLPCPMAHVALVALGDGASLIPRTPRQNKGLNEEPRGRTCSHVPRLSRPTR
jgi:hypothetical protein